MKDYIKYHYNLSVSNIKEYPEYSYFQWRGKHYYLCLWNRTKKEFEEIERIIEECLIKKIPVLKPIKNNNGVYLTEILSKDYILLERDELKEYDILDMLKRQKMLMIQNSKKNLDRSNWVQLWTEKIDYLEYQVHELGKKYPVIINCFSYYDALAQNAISYAKQSEKYYVPLNKVVSHKRVNYPNNNILYDNPLYFVIDIEVRDISEYIKNMALKDVELALIDLRTYIEIEKPNLFSLSMLYARLLYPSYYFDIHERIINKNETEEKLVKLTEQIDTYEIFLKKALVLMRNYAPIEEIDWIIKKEL